jgi:hypothetical protein
MAEDTVRPTRRPSDIIPLQDVTVPAHLLRATGNLGSQRDNTHTTHTGTWEPQSTNPFHDSEQIDSLRRHGTQDSRLHRNATHRSTSLQRTGTHQSTTLERSGTLNERRRSNRFSWFSNTGGKRNSQQSGNLPSPYGDDILRPNQRLSYIPGSTDVLALSPRASRSPSPTLLARTATQSTKKPTYDDPFATKTNSWQSNPFATRDNSVRNSAEGLPQEPDAVHPAQRRGTLASIVDGIVPDMLQRKMTNASYFRNSEMFGTYEKAKTKGVELQRKKWVQVTFEWTIYLILILFVYFVLIGRPLWNGAVWWLYWVVEHKFVLPGGFGITLGIALLQVTPRPSMRSRLG